MAIETITTIKVLTGILGVGYSLINKSQNADSKFSDISEAIFGQTVGGVFYDWFKSGSEIAHQKFVNNLKNFDKDSLNYDLQKAAAKASLLATFFACQSCLTDIKSEKNSVLDKIKKSVGRDKDIRWLTAVSRYLKNGIENLPEKDFEIDLDYEEIFSIFDEQKIDKTKEKIRNDILSNIKNGYFGVDFSEDAFTLLQGKITNGWDKIVQDKDLIFNLKLTGNTETKYDWFELVCIFFVEDFKQNPRIKAAMEKQIYAKQFNLLNQIVKNLETFGNLEIKLDKIISLIALFKEEDFHLHRTTHQELKGIKDSLEDLKTSIDIRETKNSIKEIPESKPDTKENILSLYMKMMLKNSSLIDFFNIPFPGAYSKLDKGFLDNLYINLNFTEARNDYTDKTETYFNDENELVTIKDYDDAAKDNVKQYTIGNILDQSNKIFILGESGAGKTTLTKWLIYNLIENEENTSEPPSHKIFTGRSLIPILIRCRDIDEDSINKPLETILNQVLQLGGISREISGSLAGLLSDALLQGQAFLIIDGLDEIPEQKSRSIFLRRVENFAATYSDSYIVITSRGAAYRDIGWTLNSQFRHLSIAPLTIKDQNQFIENWFSHRQSDAENDTENTPLKSLLSHSNKFQQLATNPMLLTFLCLINKSIKGKILERKGEIYFWLLKVLLTWNYDFHNPLTHKEVLPPLKFIALFMSLNERRSLMEYEMVALIDEFQLKFPQSVFDKISPDSFLKTVEEQSNIILERGKKFYNGTEQSIYEFLHPSIQEFLAGTAIVSGYYSGSIEQLFAALTDFIETVKIKDSEKFIDEEKITDEWCQIIRFCVSAADKVLTKKVLNFLINKLNSSDRKVSRTFVNIAGLSLCEARNVDENSGVELIKAICRDFRLYDQFNSPLKQAIVELHKTKWKDLVETELLNIYMSSTDLDVRVASGVIYSEITKVPFVDDKENNIWNSLRLKELKSEDIYTVISSELKIMERAFSHQRKIKPIVIKKLLSLANAGGSMSGAACWALRGIYYDQQKKLSQHIENFLEIIKNPDSDLQAVQNSLRIFRYIRRLDVNQIASNWAGVADGRNINLIQLSISSDADFRKYAGEIAPLLDSKSENIRIHAAKTLGFLGMINDKSVTVLSDFIENNLEETYPILEAAVLLTASKEEFIREYFLNKLEDEKIGDLALLCLIGLNDRKTLKKIINGKKYRKDFRVAAQNALNSGGKTKSISNLVYCKWIHRFYGLVYTPKNQAKEYYFLLVDPLKEPLFLRAMNGSTLVNLKDYGIIVASGFGDVPKNVKEKMHELYNLEISDNY